MSEDKRIVLVTGGNAGLGYELCRQLLEYPAYHVLLGSRSAEKGQAAVDTLKAEAKSNSIGLVQIDVNDEGSISKAAEQVKAQFKRLDVLVNNAGIAQAAGSVAEQMTQCFVTNAIGPHLVVEAFAPLLRKANGVPRIVNVSSGGGSITKGKDESPESRILLFPAYRVSKAGLNMVTMNQAVMYGAEGFKVFAYCPGYTVSTLSDHNKAEFGAKPTEEGVAPMLKIIGGDRDAEHACFLHEGGQYPW